MTHTPGPWGWTYDGSGDYSIGLADDPQTQPIASVYAYRRTTTQGRGPGGKDHEAAEANVRLIAAAPDLLAAVKSLLELGADDDRRIAAEAAIAKAEGRD